MVLSITIGLLGLIGALLLGRDVFLAIQNRNKIISLQKIINTNKEVKSSVIMVYESLRLKPYPNEEVDALIEEIRTKNDKNIKELNDEISKIEFHHIWKNFKYGSFGLLFLIISFLLQIYSNYSTTIELTELKNRIEKMESKTQYK